MSNEVLNPDQQFLDATGNPLGAGTLTFYTNLASSTPGNISTIYSDEALTVPQSNPYTLDAAGRVLGDIKYVGKKRMVVKNVAGSTLRTIDNVTTLINTQSTYTLNVGLFANLSTTAASLNDKVSISGHTTVGIGGGDFIAKAGSVTSDSGTQINSATGGLYWQRINYLYLRSDMFGTTASGSDETVNVQKAVSAVAPPQWCVEIPNGTKFNLASLTFPKKITMHYTVGDDTSNPTPGTDIGSGERVTFLSNSDYPTDPTSGLVDEMRFTGTLNPAVIVDVRKTVTGADAYLGPGQSRLEPARASIGMMDDQTDNFLIQWQNYLTWSYTSGVGFNGWRRIFTLNGIGTAQWVSVPTLGIIITGTTSGAKGHLLSVSAGATIVLWFSGRFQAGETVSDNNETTAATISTAVYSILPMQPLKQGLMRGNWSVGLLPESAARRPLLGVGGMVGVQPTRSFSQYVDETVTDPGYEFCDSYEAGSPAGYKIVYDASTGTASNRRLYVRALAGSTNLALVGATKAVVLFANSATINSGAFNIATVSRTGTGTYAVTFTTAMVSGNYTISIGNSTFNDRSVYTSKTTAGFTILNVAPLTNVVTDLSGIVDVVCTCGDV